MGISIETDPSRRLLKVNYSLVVSEEEMSCYLDRVKTLLLDLKPGFRVLTDFTRLESMDTMCAPCIRQIMDHCNEYGVSMVVQVIPDVHKDIGFNIMSHFHFSENVMVVTCSNLDEAANALEG